ncbi:4177_t:CDS:2, partial [Racocetra persica]
YYDKELSEHPNQPVCKNLQYGKVFSTKTGVSTLRQYLQIQYSIDLLQSFIVVDNIYFVNWIRKLDPHYTLPIQATKQMIIDEFNYQREKIYFDLAKIPEK